MSNPPLSSTLDRIAHRLPDDSRAIVSRLLTEPLRGPVELVEEVRAYAGFVRELAANNPHLDAPFVDELAARCSSLVARTQGASDADRQLVQAACLYFVAIEGDLDSPTGFHDDEAVIAAVEAAVG